MSLPKKGTKAWDEEVKFYQTANSKQRSIRASDLGYSNYATYENAMNRRGIHIPEYQKTPEIKSDYQPPPDSSFEEHIRIIQEMDKLIAHHVKTPDVVNLYFDTDLPVAIVESSDWQLGQFGVDYDAFQPDMNTVETEPGVYINIGGDFIQNIIQPSKMGSSHNQAPIAVQKGLGVLLLKKLLLKIATLKSGNHLDWDSMLTGEDWLGERAKQLKVVYIKNGGRINYHVGKQVYSEFAQHKGRFNSSFNQTHTNKQYQRMFCPWARIVTMEHHHVPDIESYQYDGKECVAIRPGTYAVYDEFARANGFYGAHVCNPTVILFPDKDKLVGFKDMYDGIDYLRAVRKEYCERQNSQR